MRRTIVTAVLSAALIGGLPLTAHAQETTDSATGGRPLNSENVVRGAGRATADATSDPATGALDASASATAGRPLLGLLGRNSSAGASAAVTNTFGVSEGVYDVTFTYDNADVAVTEGTRASATLTANSVATFTSADETDTVPIPAADVTEITADGDLVVTLRVAVPEAGSLFTVNRITADSLSTSPGAIAEVSGSTDGASVSLARR